MDKRVSAFKVMGPVLGVLLALTAGCGRGGAGSAAHALPTGQTQGPAAAGDPRTATLPAPDAAGRTTSAPDSDGDGIPDAVELELGTNPHDIDTDHDGLTDHYEMWPDLPLNQIGSLYHPPDPNGNGIIAPLDPGDMGAYQVLKNASAVLSQERVPVTQPDGQPLPNDIDGDGIPNDFELNGFYFEVDENNVPYFVKWDGLDATKKYYKTDPTQWSTDGDPFSDWEEATKINLDQRVKAPGDHPDIPAYPQMILALTSYRVDLNQDVEINSEQGGHSESSWTNSTETVSNGNIDYNESGSEGEFKIGVSLELEKKLQEVTAGEGVETPSFGSKITTEVNGFSTSVSKSTTVNSSVTTNDTSGLSAQDWSTATTTTTNTSDVARLTLNMKVMNIGTLPATNPIILCNLKLGDVAINSIVVNLSEYGEFQARATNATDIVVQYDGRPSAFSPLGDPIGLSLYQLRTLESGVPLELEVEGFTADTLVWALDPNTGRRAYLTMGEWTPYQSAIQNVTAKLLLDFRNQPGIGTPNLNGLPEESTMETRIFCYRPDGSYKGSPPTVYFGDAFLWAFGGVESDIGPVITIRDPVTNRKFSSPLALWEFSFDQLTIDQILSDPQRFGNVFNLPLQPSNPGERVYTCSAPPPSALENPKIYWATCDPATLKVRAFSRDVRGVKEMRFKPDPTADYPGEKMTLGYDPSDPDAQFFYTYELPAGYHWTGNEQVLAVNEADKQTTLPVQIEGGQLGFLTGSGTTGLVWGSEATPFSQGYNFKSGISIDPLYDFTLQEVRNGDGSLGLTLTPNYGLLHDALYVIDGQDAQGNPLYTIDYNYLRKQDYAATALADTIAVTATNTPPAAHTYGVKSQDGVLAVVTPVLVTSDAAAPFHWKVGALQWRTYTGI